jgi:molybdenum cofactor biosynthesis protein B
MSHLQHEQTAAAQRRPLRCAVVTLSDTRTPETDTSGALIRDALIARGDLVEWYAVLPDDAHLLREQLLALIADQIDLIITNGGTGISRRDTTFETVDALLERRLPGFGELFRQLSYAEIGPAAMLSRAVAGLCGGSFLFCLPGSSNAVRLALSALILPNLAHLDWETRR